MSIFSFEPKGGLVALNKAAYDSYIFNSKDDDRMKGRWWNVTLMIYLPALLLGIIFGTLVHKLIKARNKYASPAVGTITGLTVTVVAVPALVHLHNKMYPDLLKSYESRIYQRRQERLRQLAATRGTHAALQSAGTPASLSAMMGPRKTGDSMAEEYDQFLFTQDFGLPNGSGVNSGPALSFGEFQQQKQDIRDAQTPIISTVI